MRIFIPSMEHAKRVSKRLQKEIPPTPLSRCQLAIARCLGYKDWHELETVATRHPPSSPDWMVPYSILQARRQFQTERLFTTPGLFSDLGDYITAREILDEIKPSDFAREIEESSIENQIFPDLWKSEWIDDIDDVRSILKGRGRLLRAFDVIHTTGVRTKASVVSASSLAIDLGGSTRYRAGDGIRGFTMIDDSSSDDGRADLVVLFSLELVVRGGFIDQLYIEVVDAAGHEGISPGHLQHAACHIYDYVNCDRMHPAFDAEITANPCGLLVEVRAFDEGFSSRIAGYLREIFEGKHEMNLAGLSFTDVFLKPDGENEFPVRYVLNDTSEAGIDTNETDEDEEDLKGASIDPVIHGAVAAISQCATLLTLYADKIPQVLAVFLRARGYTELANHVLWKMLEAHDDGETFCSIVNEARNCGALTDGESAFLIHWAADCLSEQTETIEHFKGLISDEPEEVIKTIDTKVIDSLKRLNSEWLIHHVHDETYGSLVQQGQEAILGPIDQVPASVPRF